MKLLKNKKGVTLIELVGVIVISGIMVPILIQMTRYISRESINNEEELHKLNQATKIKHTLIHKLNDFNPQTITSCGSNCVEYTDGLSYELVDGEYQSVLDTTTFQITADVTSFILDEKEYIDENFSISSIVFDVQVDYFTIEFIVSEIDSGIDHSMYYRYEVNV